MYYNKTKKKFVISSRDFATNYLINIEQDGTLIVCGSSLNPHFEIPEKPGIVRGATPISGWVIKPNPQNPKTSYCFNINELDLKAPIPDFAMRQVFKDQGYQIEKLRKVIPKWKKLFPNDTLA